MRDMAGEIKVEVTRRETIKPAFPTPPHLKSFELSFLDQIAPVSYTALVLFYPKNHSITHEKVSEKLKKSLSEALTRFYPLAGRINNKNNTTIECNDVGAPYIEAKFNGLLSTFLEQPENEELKRLFPTKVESLEAAKGPLLLVQATFFDCGGLAVAVCASHKLVDAYTLNMFLKTWAVAALGCGKILVPDLNAAAAQFPPREMPLLPPAVDGDFEIVECVTKRFVFGKSKIAALKAKTASGIVKQPTRVEAVTALVWKCATIASRLNSGSSKQNSILAQLVNIPKRVDPPFPKNSVGNLLGYFTAQVDCDHHEPKVEDLVAKLRDGIKEYSENQAKKLRGDGALDMISQRAKEGGDFVRRDDVNLFVCSSWCKFEFYEVDFGWGKPIWATILGSSYENMITLMDNREGDRSMEVCLTLSKENMATFERDPELLAFASSN